MDTDALVRFNGMPLAVRYTIDRLCTRFEGAWQAGEVPGLDSFLAEVAPQHQDALLAELLPLEIEYRRQRGEAPLAETYARRFPDLRYVVTEVFGPLEGNPAPGTLPHLPPPRTDPGSEGVPLVPGFVIVEEIGRGGMGVVYRARQVALNRLVALKVIRPRGPISFQDRVRFRLEAEALARLHHPNIVQVHDSGEYQGQPYLVLELIEGGSLKRYLGKPVPPRQAAELVEILARAIHHAHCRGIIHRDLKPANVLLQTLATTEPRGVGTEDTEKQTKKEENDAPNRVVNRARFEPSSPRPLSVSSVDDLIPKITDFGLARHLESDSWQTQEGTILGTPAYMAPEQVEMDRSAIGPPTDVYTLGVILYEMFTGRVPLIGKDSFETMLLVRSLDPSPPRQSCGVLPRDLETICLKCLRKDPRQRYASALELAEDLRRYLEGEPIRARSTRSIERVWMWMKRNPALASLLGSTLVLLVAVALVSTMAAIRLGREQDALLEEKGRARRAEEQRKLALVDSLLIAAPDSVPYILGDLATIQDVALVRLREKFQDREQPPLVRIRAAVARTVLGESEIAFLLDVVPNAPAAECRNLSLAFRAAREDNVAERLLERFRASKALSERIRFGILLLDLGDSSAVATLLAPTADPGPRSALMDAFRTWHGSLAELPTLLRQSDEACRSGLCAALGLVDLTTLSPAVGQELTRTLLQFYREAPDGGTHAAADWTLRQWRIPLPAIPATRDPVADRRWFVNSLGMTLVATPPGILQRPGNSVALVTRPLLVSNREVSIAQFQRFVADHTYPDKDKPTAWPGPARETCPLDDGPVNMVDRPDAYLFCNWLSLRENRKPCYARAAGTRGWKCDFTADGYRLPTDAEWEHASRAGARTAFFAGADPRWLSLFAHVADIRALSCGSRMPNRWGLFDMVGNVWEMAWDYHAGYPTGVVFDPEGPTSGSDFTQRGGAYDSGSYDCFASHHPPGGGRHQSGGFRVVRGSSGKEAGLDQRLALLGQAIRMAPDHPDLLRARGELCVRSMRCKEALPDLLHALDLTPDRDWEWIRAGVVLSYLEDRATHRTYCKRMLERYAATSDPMTAERTVKFCLLLPGGVDDLGPVVKLADRALKTEKTHVMYRYFQLARGMAAYREGKYDEALEWLGRSLSQTSNPLIDVHRAIVYLFQAMAHHQLMHESQARLALAKARPLLARILADIDGGRTSAVWHDTLLAATFHREAQALLGPGR